MKRTLKSGPVSSRYVHRWLRKTRARRMGPGSDVYLIIRWPDPFSDQPRADRLGIDIEDDFEQIHTRKADMLGDETYLALINLDSYCKTLDVFFGMHHIRTSRWKGRATRSRTRWITSNPRHGRRGRGWSYRREHDADLGWRYSRLIADLLRSAHRNNINLTIELVRQ